MYETTRFLVGYGRADISPQESVPLKGFGSTSNRMSQNILDPLYATCLALTDPGGETVLLYGLDLISPGDQWPDQVVPAVSRATGIPQSHILASGTHTHSGPDMSNLDEPSIPRYCDFLEEQSVRAAKQALADRKSACLYGTITQTQSLNFVRRYILQDGSAAGDNYGNFDQSPVDRHESEADRSMQLLKFVREGGEDVVVANFQVHPLRTGGMKKYDVSADLVGVMRMEMEARTGCRFLYFTGGAGNISPYSRIKEENVYRSYLEHGKAMADAAIAAQNDYRPLSLGAIKVDQVMLDCPTDHTQDHRVEEALYICSNFDATGDYTTWTAEAIKRGFHSVYHAGFVVTKSQRPHSVSVDLRTLSIGDVAFAFPPYEMFDSNAMQIKEGSPFPMTMVLACANGANRSYVPSALGFKNGGYSSDCCWFLPGTGERFVEEFIASLKRLKN